MSFELREAGTRPHGETKALSFLLAQSIYFEGYRAVSGIAQEIDVCPVQHDKKSVIVDPQLNGKIILDLEVSEVSL